MSKVIQLNDSCVNKTLIRRIREYQKENRLPSFVWTVCVLCIDSLDLKKILK